MAQGLRHPVMQWLVYGHVWVALAAVAQTVWTARFLPDGGSIGRYALGAGLGAFAAYGAMRLARAGTPEKEQFAELAWVAQRRRLLTGLVAVAAVSALWAIWPERRTVLTWAWPALLLVLLYITPFSTRTGVGFGLRALPFAKAFLIAAVWVLVTVALPLQLHPAGRSPWVAVAMASMRFPFILALAIAFDIRDRATDPPGMRTVPQLLGTNGAKGIAVLLLLISAVLELAFLRGLGYSTAGWGVLLGYGCAIGVVVTAPPQRDAFHYGFLIDGAMVIVPLLILLGTWSGWP